MTIYIKHAIPYINQQNPESGFHVIKKEYFFEHSHAWTFKFTYFLTVFQTMVKTEYNQIAISSSISMSLTS